MFLSFSRASAPFGLWASPLSVSASTANAANVSLNITSIALPREATAQLSTPLRLAGGSDQRYHTPNLQGMTQQSYSRSVAQCGFRDPSVLRALVKGRDFRFGVKNGMLGNVSFWRKAAGDGISHPASSIDHTVWAPAFAGAIRLIERGYLASSV